MKISTFTRILFILFFPFLSLAQNSVNPTFEEFVGKVYKIPARKITKGYTPYVIDYEQIAETRLKELNIPERPDSILFPGVPVTQGYGIIFKSTMEIPKSGNYAFNLESDDGSILWIDSTLVLNHDKVHKMSLKTDTLFVEKGIYPIKLWYMQAIPDRYGLVFSADYVNDTDTGNKQLKANVPIPKTITFSEQQLQFETNSSTIKSDGISLLNDLAKQIEASKIQKITIIGHTDNEGSLHYNETLSLNRAKAVRDILRSKLPQNTLEIIVIGKGETEPIQSNETAQGRSQNRRVQIQFS